jgi:hypothetical protein
MKNINDYLMFKEFNKYDVASENEKGFLWIRERNDIKIQVFTSSEKLSPDSSFLVEISINKTVPTTSIFEEGRRLSGNFVAGPFKAEALINSGILDNLESAAMKLGQ